MIHRKLSHGTRTEPGERFAQRALSIAATCRQRQRSLFEYLTELLTAHTRGDPLPRAHLSPGTERLPVFGARRLIEQAAAARECRIASRQLASRQSFARFDFARTPLWQACVPAAASSSVKPAPRQPGSATQGRSKNPSKRC